MNPILFSNLSHITKQAVVVAQLVEWPLPIPEVYGSNPVIGKIYWTFVFCQLYWKDENKEKEAGNGPFLIIKNIDITHKHLKNIFVQNMFSIAQ